MRTRAAACGCKGQVIAMVVVGLLTGIGLWLLGMPSALALGLLAGLLEFIPFAGPIIAADPGDPAGAGGQPRARAVGVAALRRRPAVRGQSADAAGPAICGRSAAGVVLLFSLLGFGILFGTLGSSSRRRWPWSCYVLVKRLYVHRDARHADADPGRGQGARRVHALNRAASSGPAGGVAGAVAVRSGAGEAAALDDQIFVADRPAFEEAFEDLARAGGVARLGRQATCRRCAGSCRGCGIVRHGWSRGAGCGNQTSPA